MSFVGAWGDLCFVVFVVLISCSWVLVVFGFGVFCVACCSAPLALPLGRCLFVVWV